MSAQELPQPILTFPNSISVRRHTATDALSLAYHANNRKIWLNLTDRYPFPYKLSDADWWISYCNQPENFISTLHVSAKPPEECQDSFKARQKHSSLPGNYAICHNDNVIGSIGLEHDARTPRVLTLGYWLSEEYWGKGIITMVTKGFIVWVFETFPWAMRLDADAYSWNEGSQKVLKKCGFEYEGTQKYRACKDGKFGDIVNFGLIRPGFVPDS